MTQGARARAISQHQREPLIAWDSTAGTNSTLTFSLHTYQFTEPWRWSGMQRLICTRGDQGSRRHVAHIKDPLG